MGDPPGWRVEGIRKDHLRDAFDCGVEDLNVFLRRYARQNEELRVARTFVATRPGDPRVYGYYTVCSGAVGTQDLRSEDANRLPQCPVPVTHLARLAVDRSVQGRGLGEFLLVDVLARSLAVSRNVASYAVEVAAIDDRAREFYRRYGFREFPDDRLHLYLPMRTIAEALGHP